MADEGTRCATCGNIMSHWAHYASVALHDFHPFARPERAPAAKPGAERCCPEHGLHYADCDASCPPLEPSPATRCANPRGCYEPMPCPVHAPSPATREHAAEEEGVHETVNRPQSVNAAIEWARGTQMGEVLIAELVGLRDTLAYSGRRAAEEQREIAALRAEVERLKERYDELHDQRFAEARKADVVRSRLDTATRALREIARRGCSNNGCRAQRIAAAALAEIEGVKT